MIVEGRVDCQEASERLPWLVNGTLDAEEGGRVRAHLHACAACRQELAETRRAGGWFDAHLPAATLVALGWDQPPADVDPDLVRRHLASCTSCAEELALVRESRALEGEDRAAPAPLPRRPVVTRYAGLAASVAAAFVAGVLWRSSQEAGPHGPDPADQQRLAARVSDLEGELKRAREAGSELQGRIGRIEVPQPNLPVAEVFPAGPATRGTRSVTNEIVIPEGPAFVALLLNTEQRGKGPATVEVLDEGGTTLWSGRGLETSSLGGYTLGLPASLLPAGRYTIRVLSGGGGPMETYPIRVRRTQ